MLGAILALLIVGLLTMAFMSWIIMLIWNVVAASLGWHILDFQTTFCILFLISFVINLLRGPGQLDKILENWKE
jgi:hypothetical protein